MRSYFNNHYGAKAVVNALQFKEVLGQELTADQEKALTHAHAWTDKINVTVSTLQQFSVLFKYNV